MNHFQTIIAGRSMVMPETEVLAKRTLDSKTYVLDGGKFRLIKTGAPIHYDLDGELDEIDLTPRSDGDEWVIDKAPFILRLAKNGLTGTYRSRATGIVTPFGHPGAKVGELDGAAFRWPAIVPNKDVALQLRPAGIDLVTELLSATADRTSRWSVGGSLAHENLRAVDREGNAAELTNGSFTGRVSKIVDPKTRRREFVTDVAYPVRIV